MKISIRSFGLGATFGGLVLAAGLSVYLAKPTTAQSPIQVTQTAPAYYVEEGDACIGVSRVTYMYKGPHQEPPVRRTDLIPEGRTLLVGTTGEAEGEHIVCFPQSYEVNYGNACEARNYVPIVFVDSYYGVFERMACRTLWVPQRVR